MPYSSRRIASVALAAVSLQLLVVAGPASAQPSAEQQSALRNNCRSDFMSNCSGVTPGGAEEFLKQGDRIEFVQDAFVLENLINQLAATFLRRDQGSASESNQGGNQGGQQSQPPPAQEPKR